MKLTLFSSLNIDDCIQQLDQAIDKTNVGSKYFYGNIDGYKIKVGSCNTPYRNSFAPFFYGELKPQDTGTLIIGSFQMDPAIRTLTMIFFLFCIFVSSWLITGVDRVMFKPKRTADLIEQFFRWPGCTHLLIWTS